MFIAEVGKLSMVGKSEVWIIVDSGKLSRESDGREICSRKKDVAPIKGSIITSVIEAFRSLTSLKVLLNSITRVILPKQYRIHFDSPGYLLRVV